MITRHLYLNKIRPFIDTEFIKIIVGIRRSGKSTIMMQIISELLQKGVKKNQIIQINFEDYQNRELKNKDILYEYIVSKLNSSKKTYIFLDEIQEVDRFEEIINSLNVTKNVDIYLTGSNSKLLSGEYASLLTGRYVSFEIFPFSFKEMVEYYPNESKDEIFKTYVNFGGLPQIQLFSTEREKKQILTDLYNSVVVKDLIQRHAIREVDLLEKYLNYLLNTISSLFSAQSITNFFKSEGRTISRDTLYNYIKFAKEGYFIYTVQRYDIKGKKLLTSNEKLFVNDQGFRGIKFNNEADIEKILENIVYFELLRRGYKVSVGYVGEKEVDFIASKGANKEYYQIAYVLGSESTINREFDSLLAIEDAFPKFVLSTDRFDFSREGVIHMNIIDFLLMPE